MEKNGRARTIEQLMGLKFPMYPKFKAAQNRVSGLPGGRVVAIIRGFQDYRAELESKTDNALQAMLASLIAEREQALKNAAIAQENARWFNQKNCNADYFYWAAFPHWSADEATALSLGKDPRKVSRDLVQSHSMQSAFALKYLDAYKLIDRVFGGHARPPSFLLDWASRTHYELPDELKAAVDACAIPMQYASSAAQKPPAKPQQPSKKPAGRKRTKDSAIQKVQGAAAEFFNLRPTMEYTDSTVTKLVANHRHFIQRLHANGLIAHDDHEANALKSAPHYRKAYGLSLRNVKDGILRAWRACKK